MTWTSDALSTLEGIPVSVREVVYAFIDLKGAPSASDVDLLDADERQRSERFVFEPDRTRFTLAHAALRLVLARCLGVDPTAIGYELGPHRKPRLAGGNALEFNMAHSHDLGIVAVSRDGPVGVDIERLRDVPDAPSLAGAYFSAREQSALAACPAADMAPSFLRYWTRKEAVIKASGEGLNRELDTFDVDTAPRSLALPPGEGESLPSRWWVLDLPAPQGFLAAGANAAHDADPPRWRPLDRAL